MVTPFGAPVDPEVNKTYARSFFLTELGLRLISILPSSRS